MTTNQQLTSREAAAFLQGFITAKKTRTPKYLHRHLRTAAQIFSGGALNPLDVVELVDASKKLWQDALKPAKKKENLLG